MADKRNSRAALAIDSSGDIISVALDWNGKISAVSRRGVKQEEYLFPLIDKLLSRNGLELSDIGTVCVLRVPGRFTGIRIGLAFAAVMRALNKSRPLSATLFSAIAFAALSDKDFIKWRSGVKRGLFACVVHAFRDEYFCQLFDMSGGVMRPAGEPKWLPGAELAAYLRRQRMPLYCAGWAEHGGALTPLLPPGAREAAASLRKFSPAMLLKMAKHKNLMTGSLQPLYLKPARFELSARK